MLHITNGDGAAELIRQAGVVGTIVPWRDALSIAAESAGCVVSGAVVKRSLLFNNVRVNSYSEVSESVILPDVDIGRHCTIRRAVIERWTRIPANTVVGEDPEEDARRFHITEDGIVVVTPEMLERVVPDARARRPAMTPGG